MKRDELRASLEAKSIIMPDWPKNTSVERVLVVDRCGCSPSLITVRWKNISVETQAREACIKWAELIEEVGGFSGNNYPNNESVYVIFHDGEVIEATLSTDWDPSFFATIKAA